MNYIIFVTGFLTGSATVLLTLTVQSIAQKRRYRLFSRQKYILKK
jgi:uncharacterized membrane protein